jgi:hypothetical protein
MQKPGAVSRPGFRDARNKKPISGQAQHRRTVREFLFPE